MVKRSLRASPAGIQQAKRAFALKGWTQENLAGEVNLKTRQPIWRFFTGQPVDRQIFLALCSILDLNWRETALDPPAIFPDLGELGEPMALTEIDELGQWVKSQHRDAIQNQCGILQLLDISHPVSIDDIYVDVNILEEISSQRQLAIADLQNMEPSDFATVGLGAVDQRQVSGMQAVETHSKLRVLGRPGVGKTTFLQHLAIQCIRGEFAIHAVPIFIVLREFAEESRQTGEFSLLNAIRQVLLASGITNAARLDSLLKAGRILLLLDGLDEVLNQDTSAVLREIRRFADQYHRNRFVVSCRTAAHKLRLRGFTDVEIAPFTQTQITTFTQKWFAAFGKTPESGQNQSVQFMQKLDLAENWQFRQLVVTPLFLHLACWVFQGQEKFPSKRTEFYKQGLDLLLGQWDEAKGVERDQVYRGFLLPQKLRLLSQLAAVTFEQGQYFFDQRTIEQYIGDYLQNLPGASQEPEEIQLQSEAMLNAIEAQHGLLIERARGIFSFSYLAFQEYFTARKIVASHNLRALEQTLGGLVSHITDSHWREVFLLTAAMLRSADSLMQLMKQQIDALVAPDPYLQEFLLWASRKSQQLPEATKVATKRAFYLALSKSPPTAANFALASTLDQGLLLDAGLENLLLDFATDHSQDVGYIDTCSSALSNILVMVMDAGFYKALQQLRDQLPAPNQNQERLQLWWQENYAAWVEQVSNTVTRYRNIHHSWQFTPEQQQILQRYYDANQLLVDCLNSNCEVTAATRQDIEDTLLLSQTELEEREWLGN